MASACFVVRAASVPYVRRVIQAFHSSLRDAFGETTPIIVCNEIDEVELDDFELVFVVGEGFGRFVRKPKCRYVYLNFSVVSLLGNPFAVSLQGLRHIRYKRRLLREKADLFDAIMDYYPAQTRVLSSRLGSPVYGFLPFVLPEDVPEASPEPSYDVCFVGGVTPRRAAVLDRLSAEGSKLSPSSGADLEDLATQSHITLNIHMQRSNHLEIPRAVGAVAAGSALVTERSYGIGDVLSKDTAVEVRYNRLAGAVLSLLADPAKVRQMRADGRAWYDRVFVPNCQQQLRDTLICLEREIGHARSDRVAHPAAGAVLGSWRLREDGPPPARPTGSK